MPMLADCLASAGVGVTEVSRIVCGSGPGSFTSLRVAASIAKGIAAGVGCPLFSVSSLLLIPAAAELAAGRYISALPAMRGESTSRESGYDRLSAHLAFMIARAMRPRVSISPPPKIAG